MAGTKPPKRHKKQNIETAASPKHADALAFEKFAGPDPVRHKRRKATVKHRTVDIENLREIKDANYATRAIDYHPMDATFLMLVIILLLFGLVMVFSASYAQSIDDFGNATHYFLRQLFYGMGGVAAMLLFTFIINYYALKKLTALFLIASDVLLFLVKIAGETSGGATRWFSVAGVRFQPSELSKLAVIFFLASWCENHRSRMGELSVAFMGFFLAVGPTAVLLALQPHFSCLILIAATAFVMIYAGGMNKKLFWWLVGTGVVLIALFIFFGDRVPIDYISNRWHAWKDMDQYAQSSGYQTRQSLMALGTGGFFGVGLGNSRQKQLFLPESHNDYVLSIVGEELGMAGVLIVLLLFGLLIWRGMVIAKNARDRFGFLLVVGIMAKVALQMIINLAVVTNAVPVTGMALPFFSYGGTALVLQLAEMGVVLNISRQTRQTEK